MKKLIVILPVLFVLALFLAACATPPTEDMNKAYDAVTRAENDADAVTYAGNTLGLAKDALTRMQSEADAKRYDTAKTYAAEAVSNAERAITEGKTGADRAKNEAAALVNSLSAPLAETSDALNAAQDVQNIKLDFDSLSGDMDSANKTYSDAQQSLAADNYSDAISKGQNVRSTLSDINAKITEATQAASRKQ